MLGGIVIGAVLIVILYNFFGENLRHVTPSQGISEASTAIRPLEDNFKPKLFIFFIDGLPFGAATNPNLMPNLSALTNSAVWGKMEPCAAKMTIQCVQTIMEGIDVSSVTPFYLKLPFDETRKERIWPFAMSKRGYKIKAATGYTIVDVYKEALAGWYRYMGKEHTFPKISPAELTDKALQFFNEEDVSVTIEHLLDLDVAGHKYLKKHPEKYESIAHEVDTQIGKVASSIPDDAYLLIFGDHGMNPIGTHIYALDAPTFYLIRGPMFKRGLRQDISMESLYFYLNSIYRLPYPSWYSGKFLWNTIRPEYLNQNPAIVSAPKKDISTTPKWMKLIFGLLFMLVSWLYIAGLMTGSEETRHRNLEQYILYGLVVLATVASYANHSIVALLFLLIASWVWAFQMRHTTVWALNLAMFIVVLSAALGMFYQKFDMSFHWVRHKFWWRIYISEFAAGAVAYVLYVWISKRRFRLSNLLVWMASAFGVLLLLWHYPTVYQAGMMRGATIGLIAIFIAAFAVYLSRVEFDKREMLLFLITVLISSIFYASQQNVFVQNFVIRWFDIWNPEDKSWYVYATYITGFLLALFGVYVKDENKGANKILLLVILSAISIALSLGYPHMPALVYVFLLIISLVSTAIFALRTESIFLYIAVYTFMPVAGWLFEFAPGKLFQIAGFLAATAYGTKLLARAKLQNSLVSALFFAFTIVMLPPVMMGFRAEQIRPAILLADFSPIFATSILGLIYVAIASLMAAMFLLEEKQATTATRAVSMVFIRAIAVAVLSLGAFATSTNHRLGIDSIEESIWLFGFATASCIPMFLRVRRLNLRNNKIHQRS